MSDLDVCRSSVARFSRCVSGIDFPHKGRDVVDAADAALGPRLVAAGLGKVALDTLDEAGRLVYHERGMASAQFCLERSGALYVDQEGSRYATVGDVEHVRLHARSLGLDAEGALKSAIALEDTVGAGVEFAVSDRFGFLCSDIASLGTGLRVECSMHLPALVETGLIEKAVKAVMAEGLEAGGYYGSGFESAAALYALWNPLSIGESEEGIAQKVGRAALALVDLERRARAELMRISGDMLADEAMRAYGLIRHCVLLSEHEAIETLASVRLGLCLGILSGMDLERVDEVMTGSREAHMRQRLSGRTEKADPLHINKARARYVRDATESLMPA